jgi:hypothetical protein
MSCTAVLGVVTWRSGVRADCGEVMDGVRGDVGDLSESAVRRRVSANSSSFSATDWRRAERRSEEEEEEEEGGMEDMLEASLMSVKARVETSVSASESVPEEETSLADEEGRKGRLSADTMSGGYVKMVELSRGDTDEYIR